MTPGRLLLHEKALLGARIRVGRVVGSYASTGAFVRPPPKTDEWNFEQDWMGALRVLPRGQVALLVPLVETYRRTPSFGETGGGLGDVNASFRYDVTLAGESFYVPGIAFLIGFTWPTGKPVDRATQPLATDATGVGAWQGNVGLAVEQTFGAWLFGVTAIAADRLPRTVRGINGRLGTRFTLLASGAWALTDDAAIALAVSYQAEGNATVQGETQARTAQRLWSSSLSATWSITDAWRVQGAALADLPWDSLGQNLPANVSLVGGLVRAWM